MSLLAFSLLVTSCALDTELSVSREQSHYQAYAVGLNFTCAIDLHQQVSCAGKNDRGQLGRGTFSTYESNFDYVRKADGSVFVAQNVDSSSISLGNDHACAIDSSGVPHCWGSSTYKQLGDGSGISESAIARKVKYSGSSIAGAIQVSAGANHTCALNAEGSAFCWGQGNTFHQLGTAMTVSPSEALLLGNKFGNSSGTLTRVHQVVLGTDVTCLIADMNLGGVMISRGLICFGFAQNGSLGIDERGLTQTDGTTDTKVILADTLPVRFYQNNQTHIVGGVRQIALTRGEAGTNEQSGCLLKNENEVWCWGQNGNHNLGRPREALVISGGGQSVCVGSGFSNYCYYAMRVESDESAQGVHLGQQRVSSIAAGPNNFFAVSGGVLYAWGLNDATGTNTSDYQCEYSAMSPFDQAERLVVQEEVLGPFPSPATYRYMIRSPQSVLNYGENGDPIQINNAVRVSSGYHHGFVLTGNPGSTSADRVLGFGDNSYGQLGVSADASTYCPNSRSLLDRFLGRILY